MFFAQNDFEHIAQYIATSTKTKGKGRGLKIFSMEQNVLKRLKCAASNKFKQLLPRGSVTNKNCL